MIGTESMFIDMDDFRFGGDRLKNPAIVIPDRTIRWFHSPKPFEPSLYPVVLAVEETQACGGANWGNAQLSPCEYYEGNPSEYFEGEL